VVLLIVTAASDNHDSRMLVAGSMPTTTSNRKAVVPEISQATSRLYRWVQQNSPCAASRAHRDCPTPAATAQVKANLTLPAFESLPAPAPLGKPGVAAPVAVAVATATSPAPPPVATTKPDTSAAPPPATPANTAPALQAVPAPTVQAAASPQTWPVDAVAAKQFLTSVLNAIENPGYMKQVHASLEASKVKGNLLMPALQRLKGPATIERMGWTETARPGLMLVQGYVELAPDGAERTDTPRLRFVVNAEFVGTKDGTAMSSLALKDDTPTGPGQPGCCRGPQACAQPAAPAPAPMVATPKAATPPAGAAAPAAATVAATKAATQPPTAAASSPATAPAAATPAPAQAAADATAPVWPVDVAKSKAFLTSILNALESPHQTRQVVAYLAGLNVKGNLLRPVQQRVGDAKTSVDRIGMSDTHKPGLMVLNGQVVLTPERPEGATAPLRFAVIAEFVGTKDGTATGFP
jgi:hypothetical protein